MGTTTRSTSLFVCHRYVNYLYTILYTSTLYTLLYISATANLTELSRMPLQENIECPGDVIAHICSVQTNSEDPQLSWRFTPPGSTPSEEIAFNASSEPGMVRLSSNGMVRTMLQQFMNLTTTDTYIESVLELTLIAGIHVNQTFLECLSGNLASDSEYVDVNTAGKPTMHACSLS